MAPRWGGLRLEPYDPDARDADNDGIVQEGTAWERPAGTRLLTDLGDLARGRTSTSRPAGLRVVDRDGNDVPYTPTYGAGPSSTQKPGASTPLADHGAGTLAERGLPNVRALTQPEPPPVQPAPVVPEPAERSYVRVPARADPDEIDRTIKRIVTDGLNHEPKAGSPDKRLDLLLAEQGFDGLPGVVASPDDLPEGQPVYYRGVASQDQVEDFVSGDYFVGIGNFGNGVYASNRRETATTRVDGGLITFALRPDARVISYDDAMALAEELQKADPYDGSWNFPEDSIQNFAYSPSNAAALMGYDAVLVERRDEPGFDVIEEGENYLVLLNRTAAVTVDPKAAGRPQPIPEPQRTPYTPRDRSRDQVYYHATGSQNVESILRDGLLPSQPGSDNPDIEEERPEAVFMGDLDTALDYGDAVFAISLPSQDVDYDSEFSHNYYEGIIPPGRLRLVTDVDGERDFAEAVGSAWEAGDEYPDPPTKSSEEAARVIPAGRASGGLGVTEFTYGDESWEVFDGEDDPRVWAEGAYSSWSGYEGNYRMRHASAALMGLPVPPADGEGMGAKEVNEILATGTWDGQPAWAQEQARDAIRETAYLMDGVVDGSPTERPMYRGLADVPPSAEILNYQPGDEFSMPLSAFSPNRRLAESFAKNPDGARGRSVMVTLEPGARAFAAPEGYEDYFQDEAGEWVEDQTEYVTHGDFEVVSTQSRPGVTVVTVRQKGTYSSSGSRVSTKAANQKKPSRRIPRWTWAMAGSMTKPPVFRSRKRRPTRVSSESRRTAGSEGSDRSTKILRVKARRIRKFEPYDPDARDGDNDGIVQDGTPWERPAATRIVDAAGQQLRRGLNTQSRPAGSRIVDADGNTVKYTPKDDPEVERPTIGGDAPRRPIANVEPAEPPTPGLLEQPAQGSTPLADHGAANLKERGLRTVRDMAKPPEPAKPVEKPGVEKPDIEPNVTSDVKPEVEERPEWLQITDADPDPAAEQLIESYLELEDGWLDDEIQQQNLDELERNFGSTARQVVESWFTGAEDITYALREDIEAGRLGSWSREILDLVAQSPKNRTALFRGMRLQPEDRARLTRPGATLDLPLGAFSRSMNSASEYATDPGGSTANSIILKLEPEADRAFPIEKFSIIDESEYLVSGRYQVTGVEDVQVGSRTLTQVTVERLTPEVPAISNRTESRTEPALTQVPEVATEPLGSFSDLEELEESPLGPLAEITDGEDLLQVVAGGFGLDPSYEVFFTLTDRAMAGLAGVEPGEPLLRLEIDGQEYQVGANWADADPYDEREGRVRAFAATRLGDHLLTEGVEIPEFDSKYRIAVNTKTGRLRQVLAEDAEEFDDLVVVPADHPEHRRLEHILYARDVLDQWASSSAKGESLQLMGAAEKLFGVPAPFDTAKPPEERHLAIARFVYAETQRAFADMGVTHVPLHRGMGIYLTDQGSQWVERTRDQVVEEINTQIQQNTNIANELREFLRKEIDLDDLESLNDWAIMESLGSRAGDIISAAVTQALQEVEFDDDSEVELRPISSWSLSRAEANNFGGTTHPSRITVSALVPVERIFSMPATGPSMHDEMEMLVVGGNARVQAEATIGRQDAIRAWWAALVPDLQNGYFD